MPKCLIQFYQDASWLTFRYAELDSLLFSFGVTCTSSSKLSPEHGDTAPLLDPSNPSPFLVIELPDFEVAKQICLRSVLIKHIYELWADGSTYAVMLDSAQQLVGKEWTAKYILDKDVSWAARIDPYKRSFTPAEKTKLISDLNFLGFRGDVKLSQPDILLCVLFDFSTTPPAPSNDLAAGLENSGGTHGSPLVHSYLARLVASSSMREDLAKYDLKKRLYIGPTSLDHYLAMMMTNSCHVKRGDLVLDPFVGTASILVAASHCGAKCFGTDIDIRVISGNMFAGKKGGHADPSSRSIWENFKSYGLEAPEIIRMDNHLFGSHYSGSFNNLFDAIVTDPPYGIRAGAKKSGRDAKRKPIGPIPDELRDSHTPATQKYPVEEVMLDLLSLAANALKMGGFLSYLIPTPWDFTEEDLPRHPCLTLRQLCFQGLSTRHCRHMVVVEKTSELTPDIDRDYESYKSRVLSGEDEGFGQLIAKLQRALSADAFDDSTVIKNSSKSATKRRERKHKRERLHAEGQKDEAGNLTVVLPDNGDAKKRTREDAQI